MHVGVVDLRAKTRRNPGLLKNVHINTSNKINIVIFTGTSLLVSEPGQMAAGGLPRDGYECRISNVHTRGVVSFGL